MEGACNQAVTQLEAYVDQQGGSGVDIGTALDHLLTCSACQARMQGLVQAMATLRISQAEDLIAELTVVPEPDLTFLPRRPWDITPAQHLIIRFIEDLIRAWQPAPTAMTLKSSNTPILYNLVVADKLPDLEVIASVEQSSADRSHCSLVVDVQMPSRRDSLSLEGTMVILRRDEQKIDMEMTDPFGQVVFVDIPRNDLTRYSLEIAPEEQS